MSDSTEEDPYEIYMPAKCNQCFIRTDQSKKSTCEHVLCESCDSNFINKFPNHACGLCHIRDSDDSGDDPPYLKPIPGPRILGPRRSSSSDLRPCPSCKAPDIGLMTSRCLDCGMDICATCTDNHAKMAILQNHRVIPTGVPAESAAPTPPVHCREHMDEIATGVCTTCVFSRVCNLCIEGSHAGHVIEMNRRSPPPLPRSPRRQHSFTFNELIDELGTLQSKIAERKAILISSIENADSEIQENTKICISEMLTHAEQMKRDIDQHVIEQTQQLSTRQQKLLTRCTRRKNYIGQRTQTMLYELEKTRQEANQYLKEFNQGSMDGYTKMRQNDELQTKRKTLYGKIEFFKERLNELTFEYVKPESGPNRGLGKIEPIRRLCKISEIKVQRFAMEQEYVVTALTSDTKQNVLFTSCKAATKAAVDLLNLNGNPIHTRKLQDNGQNPEETPAFGMMINTDTAVVCWESSVFRLKIANRADQVLNYGVKKQLVPGAKISCITVDRNRERLAFGNDKNRIINLLNFEMEHVGAITVKEEGEPLSSISFHKDYIVVSDGEQMAVLVDLNGTTISRFLPPDAHYDLKPIAVDSCNGLAYVLWSNQVTEIRKAYVQCYSLFPQTVGKRLGNCLQVPDESKFMAVVRMARDDDRLVVSTNTGSMTIYCIQEM